MRAWEPGWHDICKNCKVAIGGLEGLCTKIDMLDKAVDILTDFPVKYSWMSPIEKKAYALGIITDEDIVSVPMCDGTAKCRHVLLIKAKARIKELFHDYDIT